MTKQILYYSSHNCAVLINRVEKRSNAKPGKLSKCRIKWILVWTTKIYQFLANVSKTSAAARRDYYTMQLYAPFTASSHHHVNVVKLNFKCISSESIFSHWYLIQTEDLFLHCSPCDAFLSFFLLIYAFSVFLLLW